MGEAEVEEVNLDDDLIQMSPDETFIDTFDKDNEIYILPILKKNLFPHMIAPFTIEVNVYYDLIAEIAKTTHKRIAVFLTTNENVDINHIKSSDIHKVGVLAKVLRVIKINAGNGEKDDAVGVQVVLSFENRIEAKKIVHVKRKNGHLLKAKLEIKKERIAPDTEKEVAAYTNTVLTTIKELLNYNTLFKEELALFLNQAEFTLPHKLVDFAASLTSAPREELQEVLEEFELIPRMQKVLRILNNELQIGKLQTAINKKLEQTISQQQREFYLKEQMKAIKKELGLSKEAGASDIEKFEGRLADKTMPTEVKNVYDEELEKLKFLDPSSSEYTVVRSYLDWLTVLPWDKRETENSDIGAARKTLEEDHYGLSEIKERIIEFMCVGHLKEKRTNGSIICLTGPPGSGKTSVAKSIAHALNRPFYRFSVGGMVDEAEIKGHRRTYIGAMPGKIIQGLKISGVSNPVFVLDEIDKVGTSFRGDPASALLEVLDPEQNKEFLDHYLDVRVDLSEVLFIVTSNTLETIPAPLRDRMKVMRLSGYTDQEKVEIADRYIIPKLREKTGLKSTNFSLGRQTIGYIASHYTRESGLRQLENALEKIFGKIAKEIVENKKKKRISINRKNLIDYLGIETFSEIRIYKKPLAGVSIGLAWTDMGGATLAIESVRTPRENVGVRLTGNVGKVMQESAEIALGYVQAHADKFLSKKVLEGIDMTKLHIHTHVPEGATPKDGPSAGITLITSMISALSNRPIRPDVAMTGEVTLNGVVLAIGGLKEKLMAAKRYKYKHVIIPKQNMKDLEDIPAHIKDPVKISLVENYSEVHEIVFSSKKTSKAKHSR